MRIAALMLIAVVVVGGTAWGGVNFDAFNTYRPLRYVVLITGHTEMVPCKNPELAVVCTDTHLWWREFNTMDEVATYLGEKAENYLRVEVIDRNTGKQELVGVKEITKTETEQVQKHVRWEITKEDSK
jgi:hypothetical protein